MSAIVKTTLFVSCVTLLAACSMGGNRAAEKPVLPESRESYRQLANTGSANPDVSGSRTLANTGASIQIVNEAQTTQVQ